MKKILSLLVVLCGLSPLVHAQISWADTLLSASDVLQQVELLLEEDTVTLPYLKGDLLFTPSQDSITPSRRSENKVRNNIRLSNYYQNTTDTFLVSRSFGLVPMQSSLEVRRSQTIAGIDFTIGGQGFFKNGELDNSRSGIIFDFDHRSFLRQLNTRHESWINQQKEEWEERELRLNPRFLAANTDILFEKYLNTLNTPEYREYEAALGRQVDSLQSVKRAELTSYQQKIFERANLLEQLDSHYNQLLNQIKRYPHQLHGRAQGIVDSFQTAILLMPEMAAEEQLMNHPEVSGFQKILLRTKTFALGNTRLPSDDFMSAGLPIKGMNYAYDGPSFGFSLQHGKRVVSTHFTPRDGVPYHDLDNDFRLSQLTLRIGDTERSFYKLSTLLASEGKVKNNISQLNFPRNNRVFTFTGNTSIGDRVSLTSSVSQAFTRLDVGSNVSPDGIIPENSSLGKNLAIRAGAAYVGKTMDVSIVAFRTGADFRSFANPYLYTDYEGMEFNLKADLLDNRLSGKFSLALGRGTTDQTRNNVRWRAQGFLRYRVFERSQLSILVSPNVYRYEVTGQESFTESSIYQLNYQQSFSVGVHEMVASFGITNLDQGWSWADSTQVAQAIVVRGTTQLAVSKKISLALDGGYRLPGETTGDEGGKGREWYVTFSPSVSGKFHFAASLRRDKYRFESIPAWGGSLDWQMPLGKLGALSVNIFYRPTRQVLGNEPTSGQFLSQQHLFANF